MEAMRLSETCGQSAIKEYVTANLKVSRKTGAIFPHLLICGPPEMGKATLAEAIAEEFGTLVGFLDASTGPRLLDLTGMVTNLRRGGVGIIREIQAASHKTVPALREFLSEFKLTVMIGSGPGARNHTWEGPPSTVIATSSAVLQLDPSLRKWFVVKDLEPYSELDLRELIFKICCDRNLAIDEDAAHELARWASGSPGQAETLVKRLKTYHPAGMITRAILLELLERLGVSSTPHSLTLAARLTAMSGIEFERWVAELFRAKGYSVELTRMSGDHGLDLILRSGSVVLAVQCKRWTDTVGESVVRDFYGSLMNGEIQAGSIITTSSFSDAARRFAEGKPITLLGMDELVQQVLF
jgi:Holliday junction resolvasome RuvABC ATP-dependent DNA helicase subunit